MFELVYIRYSCIRYSKTTRACSYGSTAKSESANTDAASSSGAAGAFFSDSQFLVFLNRWSALVLAGSLLWLTRADRARPPAERLSSFSSPSSSGSITGHVSVPVAQPPFALYLYSSLANIVSSWMQYEALKYVSFPTQARLLLLPSVRLYEYMY